MTEFKKCGLVRFMNLIIFIIYVAMHVFIFYTNFNLDKIYKKEPDLIFLWGVLYCSSWQCIALFWLKFFGKNCKLKTNS